MGAGDSFRRAEDAARASYSRLLAILAARTRDVALAEDALSGAFQAALEHWPKTTVPNNPEAWLLTTARRRLIDTARHDAVRERVMPDLVRMTEEASRVHDVEEDLFPDERLKLLFVCAHPSIDRSVHTPLMLQTVLGLEAGLIARAFLVAPSTMSQRLVRAKRKIKAAGIPFSIPGKDQLSGRLTAVLDAIYVAYSTGWDGHAEDCAAGFVEEALWLSRVVTGLLPEHPEAQGLRALLLFSHARHGARRSATQAYVPLLEQDTALWDKALIAEAEALLSAAAQKGDAGRYQLEAAIQSAHTAGRLNGTTNWPAIILLYERLLTIVPSVGARVGQASAVALSGRPEDARQLLYQVSDIATTYQPYWAALAHTERLCGNHPAALEAYNRAIDISTDTAARSWLQSKRSEIKPA